MVAAKGDNLVKVTAIHLFSLTKELRLASSSIFQQIASHHPPNTYGFFPTQPIQPPKTTQPIVNLPRLKVQLLRDKES